MDPVAAAEVSEPMQVVSIDPRSHLVGDSARVTFSFGLSVDGYVLLAGTTGATYDAAARRMTVASGVAEQSRIALSKVDDLLEAARLQRSNIVLVTEYVTAEGLAHYAEIADVRERFLGGDRPSLRRICVRSLVRPQAYVEFEIIARAPGQSTATGRGLSDLVHLPTCYAAPGAGDVARDVEEQAHAMFTQVRRLLDSRELSPSHVARILVCAAPGFCGQERVIRNVCRSVLSPSEAEPDVIFVDTVGVAGASIQVNLTASLVPVVRTEFGLKAGRLLLPPLLTAPTLDSVVAQTDAIYQGIKGDRVRLLHTVEYLAPLAMSDYRRTAAVRSAVLSRPFPTATGVVCASLGDKRRLIGVEATAAYVD